jgi:hypothetical protein
MNEEGKEHPAVTDDKTIAALARRVARQISSGTTLHLDDSTLGFLDAHPEAARTILDGLIRQAQPDGNGDPMLLAAYGMLFDLTLQTIRFQVDARSNKARKALEDLNAHLLALCRQDRIPHELWPEITVSYQNADLAMDPKLNEAIQDRIAEDVLADPITAEGDLDSLFNQIADLAPDDPFEFVAMLSEASLTLPEDVPALMVGHMAVSPRPTLREAAVLLLLDAAAEVRRAAAAALLNATHPDRMSGDGLRRLIAIRNWLPAADRPAVDAIIRQARTRGVNCAPWPQAERLKAAATGISPPGLQSLAVLAKAKREYRLGSMYLKDTTGIQVAEVTVNRRKRDIATDYEDFCEALLATEVQPDYIDRIVQHAIYVHLNGSPALPPLSDHFQPVPPPVSLLQLAEAIGAADWQPRPIDWEAELEALSAGIDPARLKPEAVKELLEDSDDLLDQTDITDSWYEVAFDILEQVLDIQAENPSRRLDRIIEEILEPRRAWWGELMLRMALWHRNMVGDRFRPWQDWTIVGREIERGRPLREIALMRTVAARTLELAEEQEEEEAEALDFDDDNE